MKKSLAFIVGLLLFAVIGAIAWNVSDKIVDTAQKSKTITLKPRVKLVVPEGQFVYEIKQGEATIKGELIHRVLVGKNVTVTYRNNTNETLRPSYLIRFYNVYGVMIGKKKVGSFSLTDLMVKPGEVASEALSFERYAITEILEFSHVRVKEDFDKIKWIVISDSNSSIVTAQK